MLERIKNRKVPLIPEAPITTLSPWKRKVTTFPSGEKAKQGVWNMRSTGAETRSVEGKTFWPWLLDKCVENNHSPEPVPVFYLLRL